MSSTVERVGTRPWLLLVLATGAVLLLHVWAGQGIVGPSVVFDEAGYLGNARWLAGSGERWEMPWSPQYAIGYPVVLAPLVRLLPDPEVQWRAVLLGNAALLALLVPGLRAVARRVLGVDARTALLAAVVAAVVPAALAAGVSAIAENLVLPLLPATVLAAWVLCRPGSTWSRLTFALCLVALSATHPRFVVALPIGLLVLAWVHRRRLAPGRVVGGSAVLLVGGWLLAQLLAASVASDRWDHVERLEGGVGDVVRLATTSRGLAELVWTAVGQAWYLAVGSAGLVVVGVVVLVGRVRREPVSLRRPVVDVEAEARVVAIATLLLLAAGVFLVSVVFFAQNQFRADHYVYGRHNAAFTPLWVLVAVVTLLRGDRRLVLRTAAGAAATIAGLGLVLGLVRDPAGLDGRYSPFAVPALVRAVGDDPGGAYTRASLAGLAVLGCVVLLAVLVRRPRLLVPVLVAAAVWSGLGAVERTELFAGLSYAGWTAAEEVARLDLDQVDVDGRVADGVAALAYPFHLPDIAFTTYEPSLGERARGPYVLAAADDEQLRADGARIVLLDLSGFYPEAGLQEGLALWVRPGSELERLDAEGALLPAGFPAALPSSARDAEVELLDHPGVVHLAPGESTTLAVAVRHAGSGAPWPDAASYGRPHRVRVIADVRLEGAPAPASRRWGGELPRWVRPGDEVVAEVVVHALDDELQPLAPGRYEVVLGVGQDDPGWFRSGDAATFELVVGG